MPEFGKRTAFSHAASPGRPGAQANVDAALAVVKAGKLPAWTTASPLKLVIGLLAVGAGLCFFAVTYGGDLVRDIRLAGTWQVAYDLRAVNGSCTRHNFVVTRCSVKIQSIAEPNQAPVTSEFMMLFSSGGGELLVPVRSTTNPSAVAIGYATETKLFNRTMTFLGLTGTFALIFIGLVGALGSGRYRDGAAHRALLAGIGELQARTESMQNLSRTAT